MYSSLHQGIHHSIDVKLISKRDTKQRNAIFRLRYHIYNHIFKHHRHPNLNHEQQLLADSLENKSYLFLAEINGMPVGTLRITLFDCLEEHENVMSQHYSTMTTDPLNSDSAIFSMFCILPEYNHTNVTKELVKTVILHAMKKNIKRIFIESPEYLASYYKQYQFTQCSDWIQPENYPLAVTSMMITTELLVNLDY